MKGLYKKMPVIPKQLMQHFCLGIKAEVIANPLWWSVEAKIVSLS